MNMNIPLLTLTATLTVGCLDKEEVEEVEEAEETEETESGIDGDWSLSDSDEGCYEDSYTDSDGTYYSFSYCFSFSKFDMSIVEGAVVSSDVTVGYTETYYDGGETYTESGSFGLVVDGISSSGTSYDLNVGDGDEQLDCTLSGSTLDCELTFGEDDIDLVVGFTLTK